jgi:DNA repair protein RecN (Recombination protein N)
MLRTLRIEHLVLVDSCEMTLAEGFHVITGETGAGKSILLTAIGLLLGDKADAALIRHGEAMAIIEGEFDFPPSCTSLLDEAHICLEGPTCTIRREILSSGKSRSFLDGYLVTVNLLKALGSLLIEVSDQHACLTLTDNDTPRTLLDRYARLEGLVGRFGRSYEQWHTLTQQRDEWLSHELSRASDIESLQTNMAAIEASTALHVDDQELFSQLQQLEQAKEAYEIISSMADEIDGGKNPLQSALFRLTQRGAKISSLGVPSEAVVDLLNSACSSLREAGNELRRILPRLDCSEDERTRLNTQLRLIDTVKRRFGPTTNDLQQAYASMKERLASLLQRTEELADLDERISTAARACDTHAKELSQKRSKAARQFERSIERQLRPLNMPEASVELRLLPASRSSSGDDAVLLLLTPNVGEKTINISEASGGELARIFLAIQATLADRFVVPTILFDEIDASIGGMTANAVGDTLAAIGLQRQVLAVTHFVQVASKANAHFALTKAVRDGRTVTQVQPLTSQELKQQEHQRMMGALPQC